MAQYCHLKCQLENVALTWLTSFSGCWRSCPWWSLAWGWSRRAPLWCGAPWWWVRCPHWSLPQQPSQLSPRVKSRCKEHEQTALVAVAPELRRRGRWQLLGHLTGRESGPLPHCCKLEPADYSREPHRRFNRRHDDPTSQLHISFIIIVFHGSQIRTLDSSLQKSVLAKFHTQITNQFPCFDQSHVGTWYPRLYYLNHPCFNCKQHPTPHVFKFLTSYKVKWPCVWPTEQSNPHSFLPTNATSL